MKARQADTRIDLTGTAIGQPAPLPTATVKVSDKDELGVWVVGEGVPVVFVHGALVWSLLKPLAEELAAKGGYQVIWYHRRGYHGKPTEPAGIPEQARDVVKILDELGIGQAHVVSHSAGGLYALALATLAENRLLSVTLLDPLLINQISSGGMFMEVMKPMIEQAQAGDFARAAETMFAALGVTEDLLEPGLPGSWAAMAQDAPTFFRVDMPAAMQWAPTEAHVKEIGIPVAAVSTTAFPPFRETGELLQKWQPNLTMLEAPSDHHFFPNTATAATAAILDRWIESQDRAKESRS